VALYLISRGGRTNYYGEESFSLSSKKDERKKITADGEFGGDGWR
jgi:hypothetical protein